MPTLEDAILAHEMKQVELGLSDSTPDGAMRYARQLAEHLRGSALRWSWLPTDESLHFDTAA